MTILQRIGKVLNMTESAHAPDKPQEGEIGFESSILYNIGRDFPKYNPDQLLHKKGHEIYRKMMIDDQVKAVMRFKQAVVAGRKWYFDIDSEKENHQAIADFFTYVIRKIKGPFTDHLISILSGMINGFSITEKIYAPISWQNKTMWGVADLKLRPFDSFWQGFETDQHGNIQRLMQQQGAQRIEIPLHKIIHFVHQPDIDRHYGESDLRAAYRAWWSKDIVIKFHNIFLERAASGFVWAKVNGQQTDTQRSRLKQLINNISVRMGAIVPGNVDLKVEQPRQTTAYERALSQHDKSIAKSILVPNLLGLSEQGSTGSYSQSETQFRAFMLIMDEIANRLQEVINEQLFSDLAIWNFGEYDFPLFCFEPMNEAEKIALAKIWVELVNGGAVQHTDSDEAWIRRLINAPEKPEEISDNNPSDNDLPINGLPDNDNWINAQKNAAHIRAEFESKPWLRRISFSEIKQVLDNHDDKFMQQLASAMGRVRVAIEDQIQRIVGERSMSNVSPKEIEAISIPKNMIGNYRKAVRSNLQQTLDASYRAAKKELPARQHAAIRSGMDKTQAEKFLASKAMKIGGVMEQSVLMSVQRVLENGIKYDKSLRQVMAAISDDTDLKAWLPDIDAAGRPVNIPTRIENIARTNTSDALNQARTALFSNPALKGFVLAYEYSAVLDDRTSEICEHLHGKIRKAWNEYTPPNHFFCRSILIPVTTVDDWDGKESAPPTKRPNKGFY